MDYITVKEASLLWNTDISTIGKLLRAGKIKGAAKLGGHWIIPKDTSRPIDGRLRSARQIQKTNLFRFPFYADFSESSFIPSLTDEESLLRQAQVDFFACEFDRAKKAFTELAEIRDNIYIKISALFFICIISVCSENGTDFPILFSRMSIALTQCSAHRSEMSLHIPWLYFFLADYKIASDNLNYVPEAEYSQNCLALISMLAFSHLSKGNPEDSKPVNLDMYEIMCQQAELNGHFYEAQEMHFLLFMCYHLTVNKSSMLYHLQKGLDLAYKHNLILVAASYSFYYPAEYSKELADYPEEFSRKILHFGKTLHDNVSHFVSHKAELNIYKDLSPSDYQYAFYAVMGYSNRQIAEFMKKSEKTIANRYNEIYEKLGIKGRKELKELIASAGVKSGSPLP